MPPFVWLENWLWCCLFVPNTITPAHIHCEYYMFAKPHGWPHLLWFDGSFYGFKRDKLSQNCKKLLSREWNSNGSNPKRWKASLNEGTQWKNPPDWERVLVLFAIDVRYLTYEKHLFGNSRLQSCQAIKIYAWRKVTGIKLYWVTTGVVVLSNNSATNYW